MDIRNVIMVLMFGYFLSSNIDVNVVTKVINGCMSLLPYVPKLCRVMYQSQCTSECACKNGGRCQTTASGFECVCPPGYSGELCDTKYLKESRLDTLEKSVEQLTAKLALAETKLNDQSINKVEIIEAAKDELNKNLKQVTAKLALAETKLNDQSNKVEIIEATQSKWKSLDKLNKNLKQLTAKLALAETKLNNLQSKQIEIIGAGRGKWKLYRANEILNQLWKLQLHQSTPTYIQKMPFVLPKGTQAILISVFCNFWNKKGHAYLQYEAHQNGNEKPEAKVYGYNTHFNVYANTFYYEQMIPWDSALPNAMTFKVTSSYQTGGGENWYIVRLVGYVTFD